MQKEHKQMIAEENMAQDQIEAELRRKQEEAETLKGWLPLFLKGSPCITPSHSHPPWFLVWVILEDVVFPEVVRVWSNQTGK